MWTGMYLVESPTTAFIQSSFRPSQWRIWQQRMRRTNTSVSLDQSPICWIPLLTACIAVGWYGHLPLLLLDTGLVFQLIAIRNSLACSTIRCTWKTTCTTWTVDGVSILCVMAYVWSYIWSFSLLLLDDQDLSIVMNKEASYNVWHSFQLGLCLGGEFSLNLLWNPQHKNQTLNPDSLAPNQWQRYSPETVHRHCQKSVYPLFFTFLILAIISYTGSL